MNDSGDKPSSSRSRFATEFCDLIRVSIMPNYFRGWRRKLGVLTLVIACVSTVGWVRSFAIGDLFELITGQGTIHEFASESGAIQWRCCGESEIYFSPFWESWKIAEIPDGRFIEPKSSHSIIRYADEPTSCGNASCPYCMIVIPLNLLSAYLLLSKPRDARPTQV